MGMHKQGEAAVQQPACCCLICPNDGHHEDETLNQVGQPGLSVYVTAQPARYPSNSPARGTQRQGTEALLMEEQG